MAEEQNTHHQTDHHPQNKGIIQVVGDKTKRSSETAANTGGLMVEKCFDPL